MRVANALFRPIGKGCLGNRVQGVRAMCVCVCVYVEQHRIPRIFKQCAYIFYVHAQAQFIVAQWARLTF